MKAAGRVLCRFRYIGLVDQIKYAIVLPFYNAFENQDFNIHRNGEKRVIDLIDVQHPLCVFDVGANVGEWSLMFSDKYPGSIIHAFEIRKHTGEVLVDKCRLNKNIVINNVGLSDSDEDIVIYYSSSDNLDATSTHYPLFEMAENMKGYDNKEVCSVRKSLGYVEMNNIAKIDFLKIDVEGMELDVIRGFGDFIKKITIIQFEYGIFNISSKALLYDICSYLKHYDFVIGKIFPKHIDFFEYSFEMENFFGGNYIAVSSKEKEVIERLAGKKM